MSSKISIETDWLPPFQGEEEVRNTSAEIRISFGADVATRFVDEWSRSVQERARVAAYPLALWFASCWWRLRWEPLPAKLPLQQDRFFAAASWRMSHELPAAGHGFIWPQLTFASDGESIAVSCRQSNPLTREPVRYLSQFATAVSAREFEIAVDDFVNLVCGRLDPLRTELHNLWQEVLRERADPAEAGARKIEARLGYDPDEAPPPLIDQFGELAEKAGPDAANEIAPICAGADPAESLKHILNLASGTGIQGKVKISALTDSLSGNLPPWQRAKALAGFARKTLGMNGEPLDDESLCDLLEIPAEVLNYRPDTKADIGLAVRTKGEDKLKFLFHRRNRLGRRFEAARFFCDCVLSPGGDGWLPVTDARTVRQKVQRAFAAEFLCPIDALREFLNDEFDPEAFEEASDYFGISERAITSHLANNHLVPRSLVDEPNDQ
jgi:hypothetical protein